MFNDTPLVVLAGTVNVYWITVAMLVVYKRLKHGRSAGLLPRRGYERRLWLVIVPVVLAWNILPNLAGSAQISWLRLPAWGREDELAYAVRLAAAVLGVVCYLLSVYCWLVLGRNWSMAIVPGQNPQLVQGGLYRWVRHPIYGLSVTLMLASAIVVPTLAMVVCALLHLIAMNAKASHEEKYLEESLGADYVQYSRAVGRFWPRWSSLVAGFRRTEGLSG